MQQLLGELAAGRRLLLLCFVLAFWSGTQEPWEPPSLGQWKLRAPAHSSILTTEGPFHISSSTTLGSVLQTIYNLSRRSRKSIVRDRLM